MTGWILKRARWYKVRSTHTLAHCLPKIVPFHFSTIFYNNWNAFSKTGPLTMRIVWVMRIVNQINFFSSFNFPALYIFVRVIQIWLGYSLRIILLGKMAKMSYLWYGSSFNCPLCLEWQALRIHYSVTPSCSHISAGIQLNFIEMIL